jgi:hypothetical protein
MKDFIQALQDAFPVLRNHPIFVARVTVAILVLWAFYAAKGPRKKLFEPLYSKLRNRIASTDRSLFVHKVGIDLSDWKYYTFETTGRGDMGDDMIWKLVHWPSLRPKDTFTLHGVVGTVGAFIESQTKLHARWQIVHDVDGGFIGAVPARGLRSVLRRVAAKLLLVLGSSF